MRNDNEFLSCLIIAPVGPYIRRVENGIQYALGMGAVVKKTHVRIVLVKSAGWSQEDHYQQAAGTLKKHFDESDFRDVYPTFHCEEVQIDIESLESCKTWLLETLGAFYRTGVRGCSYIDLTSGPKEWMFACSYIRAFFDNIHFYYVRGRREKFTDFTPDQINDEGTAAELVDIAGPDEILRWWVTPGDYRYELFEAMCTVISRYATELRKTPAEVLVPIRVVADEWDKMRGRSSTARDRLARSLGKHLAQIEQWNLFTRTPKAIRLTAGGLALGRALFPSLFAVSSESSARV